MNEEEEEKEYMAKLHKQLTVESNYNDEMCEWGDRLQANLDPRIDEILDLMVRSVKAHRKADELTRRMIGPLVDAIYAADGEEGMISQDLEAELVDAVGELTLRECGGDELREACRDYLMETLVMFSNIAEPTHTWG